MINEAYHRVLREAKYSKYFHTNLHVHTPATPWDWNGYANQAVKAGSLTPESFFERLNRTSLDLVGITDHNTVGWCENLITLAKNGRSSGTSKLHILPGVEITTYEGPHIIGLFEENLDLLPELKDMLIRMGLSGMGEVDDRTGKNSASGTFPINKVVEEIVSLGGLIVLPHVHTREGVWGNKSFKGRAEVLRNPNVKIMASPSGRIKRVLGADRQHRLLFDNMDTDDYPDSYAFINISDCHRMEDFEQNTTWIKMGVPSLEGLRQITYEPELRVSHEIVKNTSKSVQFPEAMHFKKPEEINFPRLIGMMINGGNFEKQYIGFSPHQNSIIGKNYAGKSAIFDFIRFALDILPQDGEKASLLIQRLTGILRLGGKVDIFLVGLDRKIYAVSRVLTWTQKSGKQVLEGAPEVYSLIGDKFAKESDLSVRSVINLEAYSQGEVVTIKEHASKQMGIIDALGDVAEHKKQIEEDEINDQRTIRAKLIDNGEQICKIEEEISSLTENTKGIDDLQEELEKHQKRIEQISFDQMREWSELKISLDKRISEISKLTKKIDKAIDGSAEHKEKAARSKKKFDAATALPSEFDDLAQYLSSKVMNEVKVKLRALKDDLLSARTELEELEKQRGKRYEEHVDKIRGDVEEDQYDSARDIILGRIKEKQDRLTELLAGRNQLSEVQEKLVEMRKIRKGLLEEFFTKDDELRNARTMVVDQINSGAAENVRSEILEKADRENYRNLLSTIVARMSSQSNKMANKGNQIDLLLKHILPNELAGLIREGKTLDIVARAGVTQHTARFLSSMGEADLQDLEMCLANDVFMIKFRKEGEK